MPDSPRWCAACNTWGDHHTDRHNEHSGKKETAEVLAELTGDDRTVTEAATHDVWFNEPCDCDATSDHDYGQEVDR